MSKALRSLIRHVDELQEAVNGMLIERDYATADAAARRVIRAWPDFPRPYLVYAAVLGQLGRVDQARNALDAAIAASPSYFKNHTSRCPPYYRPVDHEHLLDGLRKAGWRADGS